MSGNVESDRFSLSRWSRRKRSAAGGADPREGPQPAAAAAAHAGAEIAGREPEGATEGIVAAASFPAGAAPSGPAAGSHDAAAVTAGTPQPGVATGGGEGRPATPRSGAQALPTPLPPVETLTFDSDFTRFLAPDVEPSVQRAAMKKLFADPRFNVMDRLDTYIDDYSLADPLPPGMLEQLLHARHVLNPLATLINAEGHAVDVVPGTPAGGASADLASGPSLAKGAALATRPAFATGPSLAIGPAHSTVRSVATGPALATGSSHATGPAHAPSLATGLAQGATRDESTDTARAMANVASVPVDPPEAEP